VKKKKKFIIRWQVDGRGKGGSGLCKRVTFYSYCMTANEFVDVKKLDLVIRSLEIWGIGN